MPRPSAVPSLLVLLLLTGLSLVSISLVRPPEALPATAPADEFSAGRAFAYVQQIAREPHAVGTPAHATVRAYLLKTMQKLGLKPLVQETAIANRRNNGNAGYVYNLLGRLKGTAGGKAVLLMAHYDSQPNTFGAGDDGAGVAALLETARALQRGPRPQRDIIFLLTDGEEAGLYGAGAFLRHPWAKDVAFVANVEARGNSGPSMTFEISPQNGWVVSEFGKAAPYPMASSLMYEVYRSLPNNTDFTLFREAGYAGVNSAFIDGFVNYHKLTDSPANLTLNSLQHHGSNLLAVARHFGNLPLTSTKAADKVFFNPAGSWLVQYPLGFNWFWMALLAVALVAVLRLSTRKGAVSIGQSLAGLLAFVLIVAAVAGAFLLLNPVVRNALPYAHFFNGIYGSNRFLVAYSLLTVGLVSLLVRLAGRWVSWFAVQIGAFLLVYLLTLALFILVPSATFIFLFPLLFGLSGLGLVLRQQVGFTELTRASVAVLVVAALPTLFMLVPMVKLLFVTFDLQLPIATMLLLTLVLGLMLGLTAYAERGLRWQNWSTLPLALLLTGAALTVWATHAEAPSDQQPLHSQVSYYLNADTNKAYWSSDFATTDDWNRQFFTKASVGLFDEIYPNARRERLKSPATILPLLPPTAEVISDSSTATGRQLSLRLHSGRGAAALQILLMPATETALKTCRLDGETLTPTVQKTAFGPVFSIQLAGMPVSKEITLLVTLTSGSPVRLVLYDESIGLPASLVKVARPAHVIFEQGPGSNQTIVRKTYQF